MTKKDDVIELGDKVRDKITGFEGIANARTHGKCRGGFAGNVSGLFWCDWNQEFDPVPGIRQIVGHTRVPMETRFFKEKTINTLRTNDNGDWCIDCLDSAFQFVSFDDETGEIKTHTETLRDGGGHD